MDADSTLRSAQQSQHQVAAPFGVGEVLDGKYKVLSLLGTGGMGTVFRVKHLLLNIELALKTLDTQRLGDETSSRRFQTEAQAAFSLKHPNLVKVHDSGVLDDGHPFLVMDLVQGKTLQSMIREQGRLSLTDVASIFPQICFGLAHAHQQKVVHRDMKPANIMIVDGMPLNQEGSVKILDFGIAKIFGGDRGEMQTLTQTGEVFGSPFYMSPEQCAGEAIDQRSDVYSVGCVLFEALTGTPPLVGSNALRTMMQHINDKAPSLKEAALGAEFPEELESIVAKMLAKSPADRYPDIGLVAQEVFTACGGTEQVVADNILQPAESVKRNADRSSKSSTITLSYVQLGLLMVATGAVFSLLTHFADHLMHSGKPAASAAAADTEEFGKPNPFKVMSPTAFAAKREPGQPLETRKEVFDVVSKIEAVEIPGGLKRVVFPALSLGELEFVKNGALEHVPAKDVVHLPLGKVKLTISAASDQYLLANIAVFDKLDRNLLTGLAYVGIGKDDAIVEIDRGILESQEKAFLHLLSTIGNWNNLSMLGVTKVPLTEPMLEQIDKLQVTEFHLGDVPPPARGWKGRKVFQRIESLALNDCDADPILKEVVNSPALKSVYFANVKVSSEAIKGLNVCKKLESCVMYGRGISPDSIDTMASIKQLKKLSLARSQLSHGQVERLSKNWTLLSNPGLPREAACFIRK